jgi:hypothetical protein
MSGRWAAVMVVLATGALALPAVARGGGWASVALDPLPRDLSPGEAWRVELTILQHGRTPLADLEPSVIVSPEGAGGAERIFPARPTKRIGVYTARVVFPAGGDWRYEVDDGFMDERHGFETIRVGERTAAVAPATAPDRGGGGTPGDDGTGLWGFIAIAAGALLAGLGVLRLRRGRSTARVAHGH